MKGEATSQGTGCTGVCIEGLQTAQCTGPLPPGCGVVLCLNEPLSSAATPYPGQCCANCLCIMRDDLPTAIPNGLLSQCCP